ncbi:MAG: alpha/beta hydrolase [Pseudomonadota bacterium]|nr:alpha/beta hydrolase [Pseudomonadota bacterium]
MSVDAPEEKFIEVNGARLCYFERGTPNPDKPTLYFVHATGFHARVWDYHCARLQDYHRIALDQRGHGRSEDLAVDHWSTFGEDQAAFVTALGLTNLIGIGHSMGGHGLVDAAAKTEAFARLLLLDPTIASPESYASLMPASDGELHPAVRRRKVFQSIEQMIEVLGEKGSFPLFEPSIFRDYCQHGVEPCEEGVRLLCQPEVEARVYMAARSNGDILLSARTLDIPVTIVRAKQAGELDLMDFSTSPTWPDLVGEFKQGQEQHWHDCTHFIPMQRPGEVVALIQDEINKW